LIDPSAESPAVGSKRIRQNSSSVYPIHFPSPTPISPEDTDAFRYPPSVVRGRSMSKDEVPNKDVVKIKDKSRTYIRSDSFSSNNKRFVIIIRIVSNILLSAYKGVDINL